MVEKAPYTWILWTVVVLQLLLVIWERASPLAPPESRTETLWLTYLELGCVMAYVGHIVVVGWAFGLSYGREKRWHGAFTAITLIMLLDWFVTRVAEVNTFRFSRPLRPLLFVATVPTSRRLLTTILRAVRRMVDVGLVIIVVLVAYSVLGMQLFSSTNVPGYASNDDNYNNFGGAMLANYILTTTENFPTVMCTSPARATCAVF